MFGVDGLKVTCVEAPPKSKAPSALLVPSLLRIRFALTYPKTPSSSPLRICADTNLNGLSAAPPGAKASLTNLKTFVAVAASSRRIPAVAMIKSIVVLCLSAGIYFLAACIGPFNDTPASPGVLAYADKPGSTSKSSSSSSVGTTASNSRPDDESHLNMRSLLPDDPASTMMTYCNPEGVDV